MTRTIKFRAWNRVNGGFLPSEIVEKWEVRVLAEEAKAGAVQQFTGLTDKNGKEIYEGDVVKLWPDEHRESTVEVVFGEGCFGYQFSNGSPVHPFGNHMAYDEHEEVEYAEIIGNICENPELLKV